MTDYSALIDPTLTPVNELGPAGAWRSLNLLRIDEHGEVSLVERVYRGDEAPADDVAHRRSVEIAIGEPGDWSIVDVPRLVRDLADARPLSLLIDRYLAGHRIERYRNDFHRGVTSADAARALDELALVLSDYFTEGSATDAATWLGVPETSATDILAEIDLDAGVPCSSVGAPARKLFERARSEGLLIVGGPAALEGVIRSLLAGARSESRS